MHDLRYALRQLRKYPIFALVAIATLALGVGLNTAVFSVAKTALWPGLPFEEPDGLVRIYQVPATGTPDLSPQSPVFVLARDGVPSFERMAGFRFTDFTLATDAGPERLIGGVVTGGWLETLGVQPTHGRDFSDEEERQGRAARVALVSRSLALRLFGSEAAAIGSTIRLSGDPHDVVGVLPAGFTYPYGAQAWVPFRADAPIQEGAWALNIQARLAPGASLETATAEMRALSERMRGITPGLSDGMTIIARPLRETLLDGEGRTAAVLLVAVALLLIVACANLTNLLLGRALTRESEFALRSSLGASRGRLVRQALVESLAIGAIGCAAGTLLAWLGVGLGGGLIPERLTTLGATPALDLPTLAFAAALSLVTALGLGLVPALRASATRPVDAMRRGRGASSTRRGRSLGRALVIGELTVTLTLLTGVGLMARDLQRLQGLELGYEPEGLLLFNVALDRAPYDTGEARIQLTERLIAELEATPGIAAASVTSMFPRHRGNTLAEVEEEGRDPALPGVPINDRLVEPGFLETIDVPLLRGRALNEGDRAGGPRVALVSASLAEHFWPGEDPVGRRLRDRRGAEEGAWTTVVGVVGDVRQADDIEHTWYVPLAQRAEERSAGQATFVVRGATVDPPGMDLVRAALARVDPELPPFEAVTAPTLNREALSRERLGTRLGGLFAGFGLLIATLGVYGSISYSVNRRIREFGVRMALGSDRRGILAEVLREVARLLGIGLGLGLLASLAAARLLSLALSEIGSFDLPAFGFAGAVLALTAIAAGTIPAARAARVDPVRALRAE